MRAGGWFCLRTTRGTLSCLWTGILGLSASCTVRRHRLSHTGSRVLCSVLRNVCKGGSAVDVLSVTAAASVHISIESQGLAFFAACTVWPVLHVDANTGVATLVGPCLAHVLRAIRHAKWCSLSVGAMYTPLGRHIGFIEAGANAVCRHVVAAVHGKCGNMFVWGGNRMHAGGSGYVLWWLSVCAWRWLQHVYLGL